MQYLAVVDVCMNAYFSRCMTAMQPGFVPIPVTAFAIFLLTSKHPRMKFARDQTKDADFLPSDGHCVTQNAFD
ncbi:hypothetical protein [Comamonas sp. NoAH]|uniref:hypothetical protein n=1 Tax=Comamonas halotolerans TaxID=3041496 RepID=UPI0024E15BA0|nr:hypothetical protein [Comamonas sp. NoAH]